MFVRSPYGSAPREVRAVVGPAGVLLGDSDSAVAFVSRHGLLASGVTCPLCGHLAAGPGDWHKIHQSKRGEGVPCRCGVLLLASPDDDIDPVAPGLPYDEALYHSFAKPPGWTRPLQRVLKRPPAVGDWVVIKEYVTSVGGILADLTGGEGRVTILVIGTAVRPVATVALAGNSGFGGSDMGASLVEVPLDRLAVCVSSGIAKGDQVLITRGNHAGKLATVVHLHGQGGRMDLSIDDLSINDIPVEHVEKHVPDSEYLSTLK